MPNHRELSHFIWSIADLLRGPYRPPQYERVMLPMTVLRRFDCVLLGSKEKVLREYERQKPKLDGDALEKMLNRAAGERFHNHSPLTFEKLLGDPEHIDQHLISYINGFSANVRRIFEFFEFSNEIEKMRDENILFLVVRKFCEVDLHPRSVPPHEMGALFENLIRRFNEAANETAGDHFTPREVIRLMVHLLFDDDDALLATPGTVRKLLDPACGTGGMLAEAQNYLRDHHADARLYVYGQDYNKRSYAIAAADMLLKEVDHNGTGENIRFGDSLVNDQFRGERFDYLLANPPFGVDWKKQSRQIEDESCHGHAGRFGAGLPRVNDGSLLFLQHMVSKFEPYLPEQKKHGSRLAIVFNGSPLFTGGAGSGESDIRRWVIENDWLEAIVALPEQMFYNTGIGTYLWVVTNRKAKERRGKIQLVDSREIYIHMRRSLGDKRRKLGDPQDDEPDQIGDIARAYAGMGGWQLVEWFGKPDRREEKRIALRVLGPGEKPPTIVPELAGKDLKTIRRDVRPISRVFENADFGYTRITVERPLRLRFQMNDERLNHFLEGAPARLDDVLLIYQTFKNSVLTDWNIIWKDVRALLRGVSSKWRESEQKLFRNVFTERDPDAERVISARESITGEVGPGRLPGQIVIGPVAPSDDYRCYGLFPDPSVEKGFVIRYEADAELRDHENVALKESVLDYFRREVLPHVPDSWMNREKEVIGYEINFNRHFFRYDEARSLADIDAELKAAEDEFRRLLAEVVA
jgi:type I restriction enzyme M protein